MDTSVGRPIGSGGSVAARVRVRPVGVLVLLVLALLASSVPTASAAPLEVSRFVETDAGTFDDCGFLVAFEHEATVNFLLNRRGPDGLVYFAAKVRSVTTWTNAEIEGGPVFSAESAGSDRDLRVTDNGDGTLTILISLTGRTFYFLDGERLFVDAGQFRFEILVDHGGTPDDPDDDEFLEFLGAVKDTGRADTAGRDFCEDLNTFLNP